MQQHPLSLVRIYTSIYHNEEHCLLRTTLILTERQYFPPRFVTNLLFCLLHAFALLIMWQDHDGIRVCVTVHDNEAITLSMQCLKDKELKCLKLRNQVIMEVTKHKNEFHPEIHLSY